MRGTILLSPPSPSIAPFFTARFALAVPGFKTFPSALGWPCGTSTPSIHPVHRSPFLVACPDCFPEIVSGQIGYPSHAVLCSSSAKVHHSEHVVRTFPRAIAWQFTRRTHVVLTG